MTQKFQIKGTIELSVTLEIEAETEDEVTEEVECLDIFIESKEIYCSSLGIMRFMIDGEPEDITSEENEGDNRKYQVTGILEVEVTCSVEAESRSEAEDTLSAADWNFDENFVSCTDIELYGTNVDECADLNADKWDIEMSKQDRINFLVSIGCSDDVAYETADKEAYDIDEEWLAQIEV